mmetsp:Transcript_18133/g.33291  ORF Transcript_18133/g.33291 Transcript_18133/m.33291 type:complete len:449 (+) Transcript_18133:88-1434(+)
MLHRVPNQVSRCAAAVSVLIWTAWHIPCSGMVLEGELPQSENYAEFVGKFCFDFASKNDTYVGVVKVRVWSEIPVDSGQGKLYFMLYDDEKSHWKQVRKNWRSSTCEEKKAAASLTTQVTQHKKEYFINIREKIRPRFWYFTFVGCGLEVAETPLLYKVHATNDVSGWQQEFSVDHMGLVIVYGFFTVTFGLATLLVFWLTRWRLDARPLREHPYLQLLLLSYCASLASCFFFMTHYAKFMKDGFGSQRIRFLGVLAAIVANCTIFLIAILSSVGWAITTHILPGRRYFLGAVATAGGLSALAEYHSETSIDQSTRLYSYQSTTGMVAMMIKIFMFCWFAYQMKDTYDLERQIATRDFYKLLGLSFSLWLLNVPISVALAFGLSSWVRYKIVTSVDLIARFLGQALLSGLLCGSLSPITEDNTFPARDTIGLDSAFDKLDEGLGRDDL